MAHNRQYLCNNLIGSDPLQRKNKNKVEKDRDQSPLSSEPGLC